MNIFGLVDSISLKTGSFVKDFLYYRKNDLWYSLWGNNGNSNSYTPTNTEVSDYLTAVNTLGGTVSDASLEALDVFFNSIGSIKNSFYHLWIPVTDSEVGFNVALKHSGNGGLGNQVMDYTGFSTGNYTLSGGVQFDRTAWLKSGVPQTSIPASRIGLGVYISSEDTAGVGLISYLGANDGRNITSLGYSFSDVKFISTMKDSLAMTFTGVYPTTGWVQSGYRNDNENGRRALYVRGNYYTTSDSDYQFAQSGGDETVFIAYGGRGGVSANPITERTNARIGAAAICNEFWGTPDLDAATLNTAMQTLMVTLGRGYS